MSVFIKGLLAWSVGPLKSSLRVGSFGYHDGLLLVQISSLGDQPIPRSRGGGTYAPPPIPTVEVSEVALRRVETDLN